MDWFCFPEVIWIKLEYFIVYYFLYKLLLGETPASCTCTCLTNPSSSSSDFSLTPSTDRCYFLHGGFCLPTLSLLISLKCYAFACVCACHVVSLMPVSLLISRKLISLLLVYEFFPIPRRKQWWNVNKLIVLVSMVLSVLECNCVLSSWVCKLS